MLAFCLARFLPKYCNNHISVKLVAEEKHDKKLPSVKGPMELSFADWLLAWESYGVAAAALDQITYPSAVAHKHVVAQIARTAGKRCERMAVVYDYLVR